MKRNILTRTVLAFSLALPLAASAAMLYAPVANAKSPHLVPGMGLCMNPGGCAPKGPGGFGPNPPAGGGGGGGGGGGFGGGFGAGIGLGVGLGIVNSLRPPQVIYQQQPVYQQPVYVQPVPQAVPVGLSPHDQYCLGKYKSYNIQTKRYLSFSGQFKVCLSPYM